jgi:two-component system phosphate regulon sensor histidine kinase PhoR
MSAAVKKIAFILVGIVIIPILLYTALQVDQLDDTEEMMQEIYERQMNAILFSINQYSNDVVTGLGKQLEYFDPFEQVDSVRRDFLNNHREVMAIYLEEVDSDKSTWISRDLNFTFSDMTNTTGQDFAEVKERLVRYKKANFMKIEPLAELSFSSEVYGLAFVIEPRKGEYIFCLALVQAVDFIEFFLVPKVQQVASEGFVIQFRKEGQPDVIYQTKEIENIEFFVKPLWLLPDYNLEISLIGDSVKNIVSERTTLNLSMLGAVIFILIVGVILVFRNIQKEMQLAQTKSDFVSNVSHEIRTPLALISMFAETLLLGRAKSEEKKMEYYDIISKEAGRLRNIVNKILNFSQIEANKKQYSRAECDLNAVVEEVINTYSFHLANKGFEYELKLGDGRMNILADREAVMEALINLLDNAIKYSPEEKSIIVSTHFREGAYYVAVADQGVGIESKKKEQIFDKFYRVTEGDIYNVQGAGLGLSIVKHIMDAHEGTIEVESVFGRGSTFRLIFPKVSDKKT